MKTIGIVGGVAWPSTVVYYRVINEEIAKGMGGNGLHCAKLVLAQTDFEEIEYNQTIGNWDRVGDLLTAEANKLKGAGADFYVIACNTVHTAYARIASQVDLPCIHIVDAAAEEVLRHGFGKVGLLGSGYTMKGTYFTGRLRDEYGLEVIIPEGANFENLHNALYQELTKRIFRPETREKFRAAMDDLAERGAQAIILGCTEFGMLVSQEDCRVPLVDTTIAHAKAAARLAMSED